MTLGQLLEWFSQHPLALSAYYAFIPLAALLAWLIGTHEGHLNPWKYLYSVLVYLSCIPGVFAVSLATYLVFFEKASILSLDVFTVLVPIVSMILTLVLIRKNVSFKDIPGFYRMSGLLVAIFAVFAIMYIAERMRIIVFSYLPFGQLLLIFGILLLIVMLGLSRVLKSDE